MTQPKHVTIRIQKTTIPCEFCASNPNIVHAACRPTPPGVQIFRGAKGYTQQTQNVDTVVTILVHRLRYWPNYANSYIGIC